MSEHVPHEVNYFTPKRVSENCDLIIHQEALTGLRYTLDHFSDVFDPEEIAADNMDLVSAKDRFKKKSQRESPETINNMDFAKKRSEALEIIIADQIELSDWFGGNSLFFRTTEYDDLFNGTDAVVEFDIGEKPERLALAIDSTSSTDMFLIEEKVDRNVAKLLNNNLEIKYFESQIDGYKGSIKNTVPVVIGLEAGNTTDLINIFASIIKFKQKVDDPSVENNERMNAKQNYSRIKKEVTRHPAQMVFLREIKLQLEMYQRILAREKNPNIAVKESDITRLRKIISDVLGEKKQVDQSPEMLVLKEDAVYNMISYVSGKK